MMRRARVGNRLRRASIVVTGGPPATTIDDAERSDARIVEDDDAAAAVDEAVIALARAVLVEGGTLAVRDDGYLAPLVAQIAAEYWEPAAVERPEVALPDRQAPVLIYGDVSPFSEAAFRSPYIAFEHDSDTAIRPAAVVLVGGGGPEREAFSFWRERVESGLHFVVPGTGGAAAEFEDPREASLLAELRGPRERRGRRSEPGLDLHDHDERQLAFSHYPLLMRQIVDEIILRWEQRNGQR
jgi:hypothetical protein